MVSHCKWGCGVFFCVPVFSYFSSSRRPVFVGWSFAFIIILKMELISFPWRVALHLGGTEVVSQARVECSCSILCEQLIVLLKDAEPMLGAYVAYGWTHLLWKIGAAMGRGLFINLRNLVCCHSGIRIQLGAFSFRSQNEWLSCCNG